MKSDVLKYLLIPGPFTYDTKSGVNERIGVMIYSIRQGLNVFIYEIDGKEHYSYREIFMLKGFIAAIELLIDFDARTGQSSD